MPRCMLGKRHPDREGTKLTLEEFSLEGGQTHKMIISIGAVYLFPRQLLIRVFVFKIY